MNKIEHFNQTIYWYIFFMMLSLIRKRFIISLLSLVYHMSFSSMLIYALIDAHSHKCRKPDIAVVTFCLINMIWIIHDWYCVLSIHPKDFRNYTMNNLTPFDEAQIRQARDNVLNIITYTLKIVIIPISCYSYHVITCYRDIDIIIIIEAGFYLIVTLLERILIEPINERRKKSINDEGTSLV